MPLSPHSRHCQHVFSYSVLYLEADLLMLNATETSLSFSIFRPGQIRSNSREYGETKTNSTTNRGKTKLKGTVTCSPQGERQKVSTLHSALGALLANGTKFFIFLMKQPFQLSSHKGYSCFTALCLIRQGHGQYSSEKIPSK